MEEGPVEGPRDELGRPKSIEAPGIRAEEPLLTSLRREVAALLKRKTLSFPGAQPVSFARRHIEELKKQDYYVCEKSDGMRYLLYLTEDEQGEETHYLIDRRNNFWFITRSGLHFPVLKNEQGFHVNTIIDGELVLDRLKTGGYQMKYLVFDCLVLDGNSLMNRTLDKRLGYFRERIMTPYKELWVNYPGEVQFQHFLVEMKAMQFSYGIQLMFREILPSLPHGNDGLIFTCRMTEYKYGTDPNILKWKPEQENSIDFHLVLEFPLRQPDAIDIADGIREPYRDYAALPIFNLHVYAGDNQEDPWYTTMYVEEDEWEDLKARNEPLDDRIVECYMDEKKRWRFMRFRDDKTNANHTSTVDSVIESITDRVTERDLIEAEGDIRAAWKARVKAEEDARKAGSVAGVKRKANEQPQRMGRPSPAPGH